MTRSTSITKMTALLTALLFLTIQVKASVMPPSLDGGPRAVIIRAATSLEVRQSVPEHLDITIEDEHGNIVAVSSTEDLQTTISTNGWADGEYTVKTIDDNADYQEITIVIE